MILTVLDVQNEGNKFSCFNMNDAFNLVPINKDIVYLEKIIDKVTKYMMTKRVTMRKLMTQKGVMRNLMTKTGTAMMTNLLS